MSVITIARQFGAGGKTLGSLLADQLGYTLVDEEIVDLIAQEANISTDWVDSIAREMGSEKFLTRLIHKFGPFRKGYVNVSMETTPGYFDGNLYISLLHKIIPKLAAQDDIVIVGRGGQYILADTPNTLHFLLIADMENRIEFVMEHYSVDRRQAQAVVDKQSKRRLNLYRYFGRSDYDHPSLYHMVFNMNRITLEQAVQSVVLLAGAGPSSIAR